MKQSKHSPLVTAIFLTAEGILYLVFLVLDLLGQNNETLGLKYAGILLCLCFAIFCALQGGNRLIAPALAFTAAADWFLLLRGDHFLLGVALFLVVQALYCARLYRAGGRPALLWLRAGLALVLTLIPALIPAFSTPLNLLALFYFSQLLSNAVLAWALPSQRLFAAGLTLFIGCDLCVGLFNAFPLSGAAFHLVSVGMWFFYLPSQVLIALSALPRKEVHRETK